MSWDKARDAAWREAGRRYWRWLVFPALFVRALPFLGAAAILAGAAWIVFWLVDHARMPDLSAPDPPTAASPPLGVPGWWWAVGVILLAVAAGWVWWRWLNPSTVSYGQPRWGVRVSAVLAVVGAAVVVWMWRA